MRYRPTLTYPSFVSMGEALRAQARKMTTVIAIGLFAMTACGGKAPSQDALKSKLKSETEFSSLTDAQVNCIAGVLIKYAKKGDLNDYVDGKKKVEDVRGPADKQDEVTKETSTCVTANK
jgi:hypothetical protein